MKEAPSFEDIVRHREAAEAEIRAVIEALQGEGERVTVTNETTETITIEAANTDGKARRRGFMKVVGMGARVEEWVRNLENESHEGG